MTSIIKVDNLQNQCGANIISESSNVITIGASGDTVTLAAGASQSGFGRSGSVNWDTTPKTSSPVTAVSGNGYFINTTSGAITVNLPSTPAAGDIVAIADYNGTSITNNITVGRNGSNINGSATNLTINANYSAVTLVYVDATAGWRSVDSSNPNDIETLPEYVAATGGTVTTSGDYKIHTFTGPGTFTVSAVGNPIGSSTVDYLVVAGGGGGGYEGAGGAGGYRESSGTASGSYSVSPLGSGVSALPVSVQGYPITVGGGGPGSTNGGTTVNGSNSVFSTITSAGGGGGGSAGSPTSGAGGSGGSGGGGNSGGGAAGSGNTPPTSPPQGKNGFSSPGVGGGGGGATTGGPGSQQPGGTGATSSIDGTPTARAGGGGGGTPSSPNPGGSGGGGAGNPGCGTAGSTNTGGGGGGSWNNTGGAGGSGLVVIRYKFQ